MIEIAIVQDFDRYNLANAITWQEGEGSAIIALCRDGQMLTYVPENNHPFMMTILISSILP